MNGSDARVELDGSLVRFLSEELKVSASRLSSTTTLSEDLGVDGDDGIELMEAYGQRFNVDLSAFDPARYFGPEAGMNPFLWVWWLLSRRRPSFAQITVGDLELSRRAGRWMAGHHHAV